MSFISWLQGSTPQVFDINEYLRDGSLYTTHGGKKFLYVPSGSFFTCFPPVVDTDRDYFVFYPDLTWEEAWEHLKEKGLTPFETEYPEWDIHSFRFDKYNIILCRSAQVFFDKKEATKICKALNLQNKEDRIQVFQMMAGITDSAQYFMGAYGGANSVSTSFSLGESAHTLFAQQD